MSKTKALTTQKKRAFIVAGPERSGTRLVTRILIAAGCEGIATAQGKPQFKGWPQKWDVEDPTDETMIVIRRSLPYHPYRQWPDMDALIERFRGLGFEVSFIITERDVDCTIASQLNNGYVQSQDQGLNEMHRVIHICQGLISREKPLYYICGYESLVSDPKETVAAMLKSLDLPALKELPEEIYDGNHKYMENDNA